MSNPLATTPALTAILGDRFRPMLNTMESWLTSYLTGDLPPLVIGMYTTDMLFLDEQARGEPAALTLIYAPGWGGVKHIPAPNLTDLQDTLRSQGCDCTVFRLAEPTATLAAGVVLRLPLSSMGGASDSYMDIRVFVVSENARMHPGPYDLIATAFAVRKCSSGSVTYPCRDLARRKDLICHQLAKSASRAGIQLVNLGLTQHFSSNLPSAVETVDSVALRMTVVAEHRLATGFGAFTDEVANPQLLHYVVKAVEDVDVYGEANPGPKIADRRFSFSHAVHRPARTTSQFSCIDLAFTRTIDGPRRQEGAVYAPKVQTLTVTVLCHPDTDLTVFDEDGPAEVADAPAVPIAPEPEAAVPVPQATMITPEGVPYQLPPDVPAVPGSVPARFEPLPHLEGKEGQAVALEWLDSFASSHWWPVNELAKWEPKLIRTVGYVAGFCGPADRRHVVIASSWAECPGGDPQVCLSLMIPLCCIVAVKPV